MRKLVKFIYWKNSNNCFPVISYKSYDLGNKFYLKKENFNAMKKTVFSLAVVIPLENKIEFIAHSQFSLIKYISNLTPSSHPTPARP